MPATTQIEILVGRAAAATAGSHAAPSMPTPPEQQTEAGGRYNTLRVMRCQNCGALSYIEYNPDIIRDYRCSHCHVTNSL